MKNPTPPRNKYRVVTSFEGRFQPQRCGPNSSWRDIEIQGCQSDELAVFDTVDQAVDYCKDCMAADVERDRRAAWRQDTVWESEDLE